MEEFGPRVGVAALVVRDGNILFMHRLSEHGQGTWSTPGGHVQYKEAPADTVRREVLEETGMEIGDVHFVTMTNDVFAESGKHYITLWFVAAWKTREPAIREPHKCDEIRWVQWDELPQPTLVTYGNLTDTQKAELQQAIHQTEGGAL